MTIAPELAAHTLRGCVAAAPADDDDPLEAVLRQAFENVERLTQKPPG